MNDNSKYIIKFPSGAEIHLSKNINKGDHYLSGSGPMYNKDGNLLSENVDSPICYFPSMTSNRKF